MKKISETKKLYDNHITDLAGRKNPFNISIQSLSIIISITR